jgi:hypothetical protein
VENDPRLSKEEVSVKEFEIKKSTEVGNVRKLKFILVIF